MKLLLEISEDHLARIRSVTGRDKLDGMTAFVGHAIEAHLRYFEERSDGHCCAGGLIALVEQVQELKEGQRAVAAMIDSSTQLLSKMLQVPGL